jgi:hypothetical protein
MELNDFLIKYPAITMKGRKIKLYI